MEDDELSAAAAAEAPSSSLRLPLNVKSGARRAEGSASVAPSAAGSPPLCSPSAPFRTLLD